MRKALAWTVIAMALLLTPMLRQQPARAMPFAAGAIALPQDAIPVRPARLVCGWWWGHFECPRLCPAVIIGHWRHHYRYYCEPMVLGLPWI
jgi:hypothetical protein